MARSPYSASSYRRQHDAVLEEAGYRCEIRGPRCTGTATTVDHVISLAEGGTHDRVNLRAACRPCNSSLGAAISNERRRQRTVGRRSRSW